MEFHYLDKITEPNDIKELNTAELTDLCSEIRDKIVTTVAHNGGHLSSNLGAVELTVALHYVFNAPTDAVIFDVGHQSYTHKLLTGRYGAFDTLRQEGGLSGFQRPNESPYDLFVSGHSSTAISSALGLLKARELTGTPGKVIAVIGDGAMTGGMAYEAMNNAGRERNNLIIVLNDNKMSISRNVGALARYLTVIRQKQSYFNFKRELKSFLSHIPVIGPAIKSKLSRSKDMLKHRIYYNSNLFEGFGFKYYGPIDGHDLDRMITVLKTVQNENRPVVVHVTTKKGKGYEPAEVNPGVFHGVAPFDSETGIVPPKKTDFSSVFGETMVELAKDDDKICTVTAAMPEGTGLKEFSSNYPKRFFDVGIAEQHAVTFAAGLAKGGMKPFFAVYSSFLQRGIDQIIHDVAIADLPVTFCIDRAGFVGADGETHQGLFDVPLLSAVPGLSVWSPSSFAELRYRLNEAALHPSFSAIRYPRGGESPIVAGLPVSGKTFDCYYKGDTVVVTYGAEFAEVLAAHRANPNFGILKLNRIAPIDPNVIRVLSGVRRVVVFEESEKTGGVGEKIGAMLLEYGFNGEFLSIGVDGFVPSATVEHDRADYRLDSKAVLRVLRGDLS